MFLSCVFLVVESRRGSGRGADDPGDQEKHVVQTEKGVHPGQTGTGFERHAYERNGKLPGLVAA